MKVLQLGKFFPLKGGVEKVMWDLSTGLDACSPETGIQCDMLCAMLPAKHPGLKKASDNSIGGSVQAGGAIAKPDKAALKSLQWPYVITHKNGGRCICVKAITEKAATMLSPAMVKWLREHGCEYDIIHVHHPDPMACLALRLSGYKGRVFLHWHSDIVKQKILLKFYEPLQKWLIRRADRIIGTTPVYVQQSRCLKDVQDKVTFLPIGIHDNVKWPDDHEPVKEDEGKVILFSLGRLVGYKGFDYLIEAARFLPQNYEIMIGGSGPLREELQKRIDVQALDGFKHASVKLMGFLSDEQVREMFNRCNIFVLSSSMKTEAFGIVQLEAMSCGKPIVATHIAGSGVDWVNEFLVSGQNVRPQNAAMLASAILNITDDPERYKSYSKAARQRFLDMFTYDKMISNYLNMLRQ